MKTESRLQHMFQHVATWSADVSVFMKVISWNRDHYQLDCSLSQWYIYQLIGYKINILNKVWLIIYNYPPWVSRSICPPTVPKPRCSSVEKNVYKSRFSRFHHWKPHSGNRHIYNWGGGGELNDPLIFLMSVQVYMAHTHQLWGYTATYRVTSNTKLPCIQYWI